MNSPNIQKTSDNKRKNKGKKKPAAIRAAKDARSAFFASLTFKSR